MSSDDFVYFVPKELALGELAADAPEIAQDAPGDADLSEFEQILDIVHVTETHEVSQQFTVCLQTALSDPLLAEAGVADYCIERVGVGGTSTTTAPHLVVAEDPPNPVLPATNEIFWSAIFFLLLWGLMKYVLLPPIRKLQAQRAQKLQDDRDAAQQAEEDLAKAQADYDAAYQAAREEANVLLDEARTRASDRRAELVGAAVSRCERIPCCRHPRNVRRPLGSSRQPPQRNPRASRRCRLQCARHSPLRHRRSRPRHRRVAGRSSATRNQLRR